MDFNPYLGDGESRSQGSGPPGSLSLGRGPPGSVAPLRLAEPWEPAVGATIEL